MLMFLSCTAHIISHIDSFTLKPHNGFSLDMEETNIQLWSSSSGLVALV